MQYREIMQDFTSSFALAFDLIGQFNAELFEIIGLSLRVSLTAVAIATIIGLPLGAAIAVIRFPGRQFIDILLNALMGLPPVVVGLLVYMMISRAGPLGWLNLLYTPNAMIIAQLILIVPIIAILALVNVLVPFRQIGNDGIGCLIVRNSYEVWRILF